MMADLVTSIPWQPIETAPSGRYLLLLLDPPLNTNSLTGFHPEAEMKVVVGWRVLGGAWSCGLGDEESNSSDGSSWFSEARIVPVKWVPVPAQSQPEQAA